MENKLIWLQMSAYGRGGYATGADDTKTARILREAAASQQVKNIFVWDGKKEPVIGNSAAEKEKCFYEQFWHVLNLGEIQKGMKAVSLPYKTIRKLEALPFDMEGGPIVILVKNPENLGAYAYSMFTMIHDILGSSGSGDTVSRRFIIISITTMPRTMRRHLEEAGIDHAGQYFGNEIFIIN